jgi:hypothetical protein
LDCAKLFCSFREGGEDLFKSDERTSNSGFVQTAPIAVGKDYDVKIEDIACEVDGIARSVSLSLTNLTTLSMDGDIFW